jgi:purine-binding chemotaxis protein CheW
MENGIIEGLDDYLCFCLGDEKFAVNIGHVTKIMEMAKITRVPHVPDYYKGVINLFGDVLPVIDSRLKFGMEEKPYDKNTCIIVLMLSAEKKPIGVGIIIDQVDRVINIPASQIKEPPEVGEKFKNELVQAIAQLDDEFVIILNVEKFFSHQELEVINPTENKIN